MDKECVCVGGWQVSAVESDGVCSLIVLLSDECVCEANRKKKSFATRQILSSY